MSVLADLDLRAWRGFLRSHAALTKRLEADLQRAHGLTFNAYDVLLALEAAGEAGVRMTDLAREVHLNAGALTRLVGQLEDGGYAQRRRCEHDARGLEALLTPAGRHKLKRVHVTHLRLVRELFLDRLTEGEKRVLADVWTRLLNPES